MECPQCGLNSASDASFCTECGHELGNEVADNASTLQDTATPSDSGPDMPKLSCPRCGSHNALEATHCTECGAVMRADLRNVAAYRPDASHAAARVTYRPEAAPETVREAKRPDAVTAAAKDTHRQEAAPTAVGDAWTVPESRVLIFTVLSFGLYLLYWMYLTWKQYRDSAARPQPANEQTESIQYPVWHALSMLVPLYGLYRTHAHMSAFRDSMRAQGLDSTIIPGWCVAAVLPFTFRALGVVLTLLSVGVGTGQQLGAGTAGEAQQPVESAVTGPAAEALSRSELLLGVAIELLVLAALTWMLVHVQRNINAYWSKVRGQVGVVPVSFAEVGLGVLGAVMWAFTIIAVLGAS